MWHSNILKYNPNRQYSSVVEMNEGLIRNWNSVVKPEDVIYCLGDFSFAARPVELYSYRLNGDKKIIFGNHDPGHSYNKHYKKAVKRKEPDYWKNFYESLGWTVLPEQTTIDIEGVGTVNMCHMPYASANDHMSATGDKYAAWRPKDEGRWLLHGHTHAVAQKNLDKRMIECGVDAWNCFPVSLDTIKELILTEERKK
jgi:calcineurin-like phosphoesterase family protein